MQCTWTILGPVGTNLMFNFGDLRMRMDRGNCRQTFILITSMDKTLEWKLCGSNPGVVIFPGNEAYVKLVADDKITESEKVRRFKMTVSGTSSSPSPFQHGQTVSFPPGLTPPKRAHPILPRGQVQPNGAPTPQIQLKAAIVPALPESYDYGLTGPSLVPGTLC